MQRVADDVAILDRRRCGLDWFPVKLNSSILDRLGVVFWCAIAKLIAEDVKDLATAPPLFTPLLSRQLVVCARKDESLATCGLIGEVIGRDLDAVSATVARRFKFMIVVPFSTPPRGSKAAARGHKGSRRRLEEVGMSLAPVQGARQR